MSFDRTKLIRYFGTAEDLLIGRDIQVLGKKCFSWYETLQNLRFESGSTLHRNVKDAVSDCSFLQSICIPASVEVLCVECFMGCQSLLDCPSLRLICLPASIEEISGRAFSDTDFLKVTIAEGNSHIRIINRT
jgi:hypothetical protein